VKPQPGFVSYNDQMIIAWILAGLASGFLVNYLADVLPNTRRLSRPLWWPLSGKKVTGYLSSPRVIIVLLLSVAAAALVFGAPASSFPILAFASILVYFSCVTVIDIEHRMVLHSVSLAGALIMGAIGIWRHGLFSTLLGGASGFAFMLALYFLGDWLGRAMARMRGQKWEEVALGFGDVNLAGVIGLLLGWPGVIAALFVGIFAAGLFSGGYIVWMLAGRRYSVFTSIPYAPFLCLGAVLAASIGIYFPSGI